MQILIVDDSEAFRSLAKNILNANGYEELVFAKSAREAYEVFDLEESEGGEEEAYSEEKEDPKVDLILMDLNMPDVDGIVACKRIKSSPRLRDIPIIMITASGDVVSLEKAFDAGANDYISKPPAKIEFLARIRSALALKKEINLKKTQARELREANKKLERLSMLDGLTGVDNRRSFDDYLDKEWRRTIRENDILSVIMIDIDFFKSFNDALGHLAGDDCLKRVARTIKSALRRPTDMVGRYGGEEFAVILPGTDIKGAEYEAETIRAAVERLNVGHPASEASSVVTISLGVASITPKRGSDSNILISSADTALYKAKSKGRNCIVTDEKHCI
ncbi:MAG: diguanylate cyclase [Deltaproteobacteria bacterium]|nr:diguanylate cyclase [Deltaproteobacteria bacterium]